MIYQFARGRTFSKAVPQNFLASLTTGGQSWLDSSFLGLLTGPRQVGKYVHNFSPRDPVLPGNFLYGHGRACQHLLIRSLSTSGRFCLYPLVPDREVEYTSIVSQRSCRARLVPVWLRLCFVIFTNLPDAGYVFETDHARSVLQAAIHETCQDRYKQIKCFSIMCAVSKKNEKGNRAVPAK